MAELRPHSLTSLASPSSLPLPLFPHRYESSFMMRTNGIRAFLAGYHHTILQSLMFIIFLPVIIGEGRVPITAYFTILSLANLLRITVFIFTIRLGIDLFDLRVSFIRIQVRVCLSHLQTGFYVLPQHTLTFALNSSLASELSLLRHLNLSAMLFK